MDRNDVGVGIVGLGNIAYHHANKLVDAGATIVGGVDISEDARTAFTEEYDVPTYEDHSELFEEIDAVIVTTPNRFHEEYAVEALEAGLDVLLEKPLAHTLESAERIAAAARDADGFCMVGFHSRFHHQAQIIKEKRSRVRSAMSLTSRRTTSAVAGSRGEDPGSPTNRLRAGVP